ncbi:GNAT family N-acetyltransferase [Nocardia cyriacigeorgica]|uniref:GNAT family N-acetyltransferase n=1 Tax=Nocardia cyriacigeorgica TaxID=135487 RepID=A0A5R8PCT2_9NOCA|nr:GNAT family N-acetyltransferase [Nocardia cyriacigeorgica]TLG09502.1 GNAT family N-acetyltransferase [Nocardia cyriacigeorgica]
MTRGEESTVRVAVRADLDECVELLAQVAAERRWIGLEPPFDTADAARKMESTIGSDMHGVFVAEVDGRIAGMASVRFDSAGVTGFAMMVAADHRGRGLGPQLLDRVIEWSRNKGAHKVGMKVWPHNQTALALYRRAGFEVEGVLRQHFRRRNGELWDAVIMGLLLEGEP